MSAAGTVLHAYRGWHIYWLCWTLVMFGSFLAVEVYALATDWQRTLSASVWAIEDFVPGQQVSEWTVAHFWFMAIYGCLVFWLFFHFGMGWWRG